MPSSHLVLCHPLLLLPSIPPSIRVFSNESTLIMRWPKYWSFSFSISSSNEHTGLISSRTHWLDLLAVQGTLKSLLQHHSSKASILQCSAFFTVQLSHPYMITGKTILVGIVLVSWLWMEWGWSSEYSMSYPMLVALRTLGEQSVTLNVWAASLLIIWTFILFFFVKYWIKFTVFYTVTIGPKMFFGQPVFPVMHFRCRLECIIIPIIILHCVHVCIIVFKAIVMNICSLRSVT